MGDLATSAFTLGGPWALVALAVVMMLRGDIVSRRVLDDALRDRDAWRQAHTVSEDGRHEAQRQNGELLEVAHTSNRVLTSLPTPAREVSHAPVDQAATPPAG